MNTEFFINETFNAGLKAVFETVVASGDSIINSAAGKVAASKDEGVHFRMNSKMIFHGALAEGHFGFVGILDEAIIAERNNAFVRIDYDATHLRRRVFRFGGGRFGDAHKVFVPVLLCTHSDIVLLMWV